MPPVATPWLAFFISRQATPSAIVMAYDLARALRDSVVPVAGGFDAPIERDCLTFLLRGRQPLLVMPARPLERFHAPRAWQAAIAEGRLRLESPFSAEERGSPLVNARRRNQALAERASAILVAYAHPGGGIDRLVGQLLSADEKPVYTLALPENDTLIQSGAKPLRPDALPPELVALGSG